jgi:DNA-binding NarL/FixJ family response regulator
MSLDDTTTSNNNNDNDDDSVPHHQTRHRQQLQWRRDHVQELSSKGLTEREIAKELQLSQGTIHRDLAILRIKAKTQISKYIDEQLPAEYHLGLMYSRY